MGHFLQGDRKEREGIRPDMLSPLGFWLPCLLSARTKSLSYTVLGPFTEMGKAGKKWLKTGEKKNLLFAVKFEVSILQF